MLNIFGALRKRRPDPDITMLRQQLRATMQAMHNLTIEQLKKDLEPYSAEINWENPSGRKPEPTEPRSANQDSPEPGESGSAAGLELPARRDDPSRDT